MKRVFVILIALMLFTACTTTPTAVPTVALVPSNSPIPTIAITAIPTIAPTFTDTPTATPSRTPNVNSAALTVRAHSTQFTATHTAVPTRTPLLPPVTLGPTRTPKPSQVLWRGDLHIHTTCSDGKNTYEEMVQRALELQFDFIAITDHEAFYVEKCAEALGKCQTETRLLCIPGAEVGQRVHLLAIGIQYDVDPFQPIKARAEEIHRQGALAIAAHPYEMSSARYTEEELLYSNLDAMECARGSTEEENQRQLKLSEEYNIPCVYNSDAHSVGSLGWRFNVCSVPINSLADLKAALIGKKCKMK